MYRGRSTLHDGPVPTVRDLPLNDKPGTVRLVQTEGRYYINIGMLLDPSAQWREWNGTDEVIADPFGHLGIPQIRPVGDAYTAVLGDAGKCIYYASDGSYSAPVVTIANGLFPIGTVIKIKNMVLSDITVTIALTGATFLSIPGGETGNRSLGLYGECYLSKEEASLWNIAGNSQLT